MEPADREALPDHSTVAVMASAEDCENAGLVAASTTLRDLVAERDRLRAEAVAVKTQRDEAVRERDEMRRANVTPEDADRPYGQSVQYWQDKCLDHATHADRWRVRAITAEAEIKLLREICRINGWPEFSASSDETLARCEPCAGRGVTDDNGNPGAWGRADSNECAHCDGSGSLPSRETRLASETDQPKET